MTANTTIIKVGIISPRTYSLGGHDVASKERVHMKEQIVRILKSLIRPEHILIGLTGLSIGVETDFAEICLEQKMDYITYLAFSDITSRWRKLPESYQIQYSNLLNKSLNNILLAEGLYSPRKIFRQQLRIAHDADVLILVNTPMKTYEYLEKYQGHKQIFNLSL